MKFGKLYDISDVSFHLPYTDSRSYEVLNISTQSLVQYAYIGSTAWGCHAWKGKIYPKNAQPTNYLCYYAHSFNTIELNTTHYRIPTYEQTERWRELVQHNANFRFCPKMPQSISHYAKLQNCEPQLQAFAAGLQGFGNALGAVFMQLPEGFSTAGLAILTHFLAEWRVTGIPLSVEYRHPSWFSDGQLIAEARDVMEGLGIGSVITDVAGRRDVAHTSLTNGTAMIRFVGNALHPTDYTRADAWVEMIADWAKHGLRQLYLFVHEPDEVLAPEMSAYFARKLNERLRWQLPIAAMPPTSGGQATLF